MKKLKANMRYNDYSPRLIETINGEEPVILNDKNGKEYCEIHIDDIFVVEDNRALVLKGVEILEDLSKANDDENKDDESLNINDDENKDDESLNTNDDENKDDEEEPKKTSSRKTTKK